MIKEYRTISEVAGPLMMVGSVEGVKVEELGEIELANGEVRRCKVLEVDRDTALVQLFEGSAINLLKAKFGSLAGIELPVSDMLGGLTVWKAQRRGQMCRGRWISGPCAAETIRVHSDRISIDGLTL